jgi:hypothetical protein
VSEVDHVADMKRDQHVAGLCADCRHARRVESAHQSAFYLCQRSMFDATFPKYPHLPVLQCSGYAPSQSAGS